MTNIPRFHVGNIVFVFIDLQPKLLDKIAHSERILSRNKLLLEAAKTLNLPYLITSQYRKGLGDVQPDFTGKVIDKTSFSCSESKEFQDSLSRLSRDWVVLGGVETHICVTQTCLDLLRTGHRVAVVVDAVGARGETDHQIGLERMKDAGALMVTTEMLVYELLGRSDSEEFRKILPLIKSNQWIVGSDQ